MTARKIKHERALVRREEFFSTVKQGNLNVLSKVRDNRAEEEKRAKEALKQKKIEKSKQLARQNKTGVHHHIPLPEGAMRQKLKGSYKAQGAEKKEN